MFEWGGMSLFSRVQGSALELTSALLLNTLPGCIITLALGNKWMSEMEKSSFSGLGLLETSLWFVMPPEALPSALQPGDELLVCTTA